VRLAKRIPTNHPKANPNQTSEVMKCFPLVSFLFLCSVSITSGIPDATWNRVNEGDSSELYVVVVFKVSSNPDAPKNRTKFEATVVRTVRGAKKIGEKVTFERVFEGGPPNNDDYLGGIFGLAYDRVPMNGSPNQGAAYVDTQDPEAFFRCPAQAVSGQLNPRANHEP
jgi:hypothetical protein